ncbi:hypothetical protein KUTeg_015396 [Tegillarca granosa]|uniref:Uncharacterized protein n=1 Tax=Tegillarca granosa TaxID=220873 RepID=A0ABQ9EPZ6_TEGGR|nr:hypothetical protein KUTeg_015396 [Tegillarca granosa]
MTSIQLFPPVDHDPKVPTEWGTGKLKEDVNIWIPGPPTWHQKRLHSSVKSSPFDELRNKHLTEVRDSEL